MAQRTGAERLLASFAKSASARAILALAAAALLLTGCGGGSSDPETTAATSTSAATADGSRSSESASAAEPSGTSASQAEGKSAPESAADAALAGSAPGAADSAPSGKGQKHGPRIAAPKGPTEQAPSAKQLAQATVADMSLQSPAIIASQGAPGALPATYTCDGKDSWPQLRWGGVPPGSAELAVFVMNVQPVQEQLFVDWAVAGLDPGLEGIEAGQLPKGAVVGTNGFGKRGYSICPPGSGEIYMFAVYALPERLSPPKGFDARELRKEVLAISGNVGLLPAVYARG